MNKIGVLTSIMLVVMTITAVSQDELRQERFYFSKTLDGTVEQATERVKSALQEQGFGIVTELDMHKTLNEKLGKNMGAYRILGACNAKFAWQTLQKEENIGVFLPCKVLIKERPDNQVEVVAVNPSELMKMLNNPALTGVADEVSQRFKDALRQL